jgi:hypothetical protein
LRRFKGGAYPPDAVQKIFTSIFAHYVKMVYHCGVIDTRSGFFIHPQSVTPGSFIVTTFFHIFLFPILYSYNLLCHIMASVLTKHNPPTNFLKFL